MLIAVNLDSLVAVKWASPVAVDLAWLVAEKVDLL
jgi:hypothetical protein